MQRLTFKENNTVSLLYYSTRVSAGFPSPASDHEEDRLDLNEYLIKDQSATYILRVEGDSMQGAGIVENDLLVVDRSVVPLHDHIIVAVLDGEITVKRLYREHNQVLLCAENAKYSPIDVTHHATFKVWGVVVGVVRSLR